MGIAAYQQNHIAYASPAELLLMVYDVAISACGRRDHTRCKAAVVELINSLNFEYPDVAVGLLRLYQYCLELTGKGQFDEVKDILSQLRATWAAAMASQPAPK